uniref:DnaJ homolog subfamily B member 9 n=1 Tax=Plectus sambesii TaxID=2011161 RepID=A0A914VWJ6_9BILA
MDNEEFRAQVVKKLDSSITDKTQLTEILFYLGQQEDVKGSYKNSAAWKMLRDLLDSDNQGFTAYAQRLLQEAEKGKPPTRDRLPECFEVLKLQGTNANNGNLLTLDSGAVTMGGSIGFAYALARVTSEMQLKILEDYPHVMNALAVSTAKNAVVLVRVCGRMATVGLAAVYLTCEAMMSIYRWWKGEITGKRATKNFIDSCVTVAAGTLGSIGGATGGGLFGPIFTMLGGSIGGIVASVVVGVSFDILSQKMFDIPKGEALEAAYDFLGVSMQATDDEINKAFRSLCLKYHPDKSGSQQNFLKLQSYMGIIKVARGEQY